VSDSDLNFAESIGPTSSLEIAPAVWCDLGISISDSSIDAIA
jgi:hypothetical protein